MKKYYLPESNNPTYPVFIGNRSRTATATGVSFISENIILAASYFGKKIYRIDISDDFKILEQINVDYYIDLIDYRDGILVASHLPSKGLPGSISIFSVNEEKISFIKNITFNKGIKPHGCTVLNSSTVIISNMGNIDRGYLFLDILTEKYSIFDDISFYPKDACISDNFLLGTSVESLPHINKEKEVARSFISLIDLNNLKKVDEVSFIGQTEGITFSNEIGLVTVQDKDQLILFNTVDNKINIEKTISGFNFPHGVDIYQNKAIVSNYGDNSIQIITDIQNY